jgi:hypothetical protein
MNANLTRRPQLGPAELQHLKWLLGGALTLLAVSTIFYMDVDAWVLMGLTALAAAAAMWRPDLPARVPRLVHTLAFPGIVAFFALDLWLLGEVLPAMVRLDVMLLLYRNITYRQRRDDLQIVVLGLFLVVVAGVLTVSLTFAAHLLVYTGCALAFLLVITLTATAAATAPAAAKDAAGGHPGPPGWVAAADAEALLRRLREVADWRVLGTGALLFAGVVAVSALLFLAIPRFQIESSMFLDRLISKKAKSGFTDTIRFGDVTEIQQDTSVALSVDVSDQTEIPASPYWRMVPLDHYDNGTFRLSLGLRRAEFQPERSYTSVRGDADPKRGATVSWTFFMESGVSRYLPLLGQFNMLRFRETQNFQIAPRLAVVALREEPASMTAYRVEGFELRPSLPDPEFARLWRERTAETVRRSALQVQLRMGEADLEILRGVVREITGGAAPAGAAEFARQAGEWLRKNHPYSLAPTIPRGANDPLVRWMTSKEGGHCELFAGSLAVLARAAGFPARVVTGFRGGTWNAYSNNFTIRNSDAHAWTEIFDERAGAWLRTDALAPEAGTQTTEGAGEAAIVSRLDRSWKARIDSLRVFWYRRIVSFDERSQMETLKAVKEVTQTTGKQLRAWLAGVAGEIRNWVLSPWDGRRIAGLAGVVALGVAVAWGWREFGRGWLRGLRRPRGGRGMDPVRREAGRWLGKMAEVELRTAEGGLRRVECGARAGAAWREVEADLLRLRYGARETWREPEKVFRRARGVLSERRREMRREAAVAGQ